MKVSIRMKSGRIYRMLVDTPDFRQFIRDIEKAMKAGEIFLLLDDVAITMENIESVEPGEG